MKNFSIIKSVLLLSSLTISSWAHSQENVHNKIKAAFLFQFTQHTNWLDSKIDSTDFTVSVIGNNEIVNEFNKLVSKNKAILPKKITAQNFEKGVSCKILFVTGHLSLKMRKIVKEASDNGVMIVSDDVNMNIADVKIAENNSIISLVLNTELLKNKSIVASQKIISCSVIDK